MRRKNGKVLQFVTAPKGGTKTGCKRKKAKTVGSTAKKSENIAPVSETKKAEIKADESHVVPEIVKSILKVMEEVPYAEKHGWKFRDLSPLLMPAFSYWMDADGNYTENGPEGLNFIQPIDVYTFGNITVSGPDAEGNVVYTIPYTEEYEVAVENPELKGFKGSATISCDFKLADFYTGTVFPIRSMSGDDSYKAYTDIVWNNVKYSVGYTKSVEWSNGDWQLDGRLAHHTYIGYHVLTVSAPAGYDGLVLYIKNGGYTGYEVSDIDNFSEAVIFELDEESGESWDDYAFIRVSDYVTQ